MFVFGSINNGALYIEHRHENCRKRPNLGNMTNKRYFSLLMVVLITVITVDKCSCFIARPRTSRERQCHQTYYRSSSSNNDGDDNSASIREKTIPLPWKPKARCPDYPSYATYENTVNSNGRATKKTRKVSFNNEGKEDADLQIESVEDIPTNIFASMFDSPLSLDFLVSKISDSNRRTRLLNRRAYTSKEPFEQQNIYDPPCLQDLKPPPSPSIEFLWISTPFRLLSVVIPYYAFPFLIKYLDHYVTIEPNELDDITSKFGPGVSILYGTFVSLTLSILYERQKDIQNDVAVEASLLALITRNLLSIFRCDQTLAVESGQAAADQIRILSKGTRGSELLAIMYSDPYSRMLELIEEREFELIDQKGELGGYGVVLGSCRQILEDLFKIRADRLSDESLALPPTHFFIMTILTMLILLGYAINVLPTVDAASGIPSNESAIVFAILTSVYVLFYNFAEDLNNPFSGLYQIRRSSTAAHLLQAKWLLVNNPLIRGRIDFNEPESDGDDVKIWTPGIGEMIFDRDQLFPDSQEDESETLIENE